MHTGLLIPELEQMVERIAKASIPHHTHVCFRCRQKYPCLVQPAPYCTPPITLQECAEYLCAACQAIADDEEL